MPTLRALETNNERVVTTKQLAWVYGCSAGNIKKNFNTNREHFIKGKHYYCLEGEQLRQFKEQLDDDSLVSPNAKILMLWTKRGASRHCKLLGTERAWDMFDRLEENYFTKKPSSLAELALVQAQALVEHEHKIAQLMAEQKKQQETIAALSSRLDDFNGANVDGTKRQRLNALVNKYTTLCGIRHDEAWKNWRTAYNIAFHTNITMRKQNFEKKNAIMHHISYPEYLEKTDGLDDGIRIVDKLISKLGKAS